MRILIFNWRDWKHPAAGGAEIYTHHIALEWARQGHQVTIMCAGAPGLPDLDVSGDITIVRRGGRYTVYREAKRFWRTQGQGKFDLVIDEVNTRPFMCPTFVTGTPVVALIHQVAREVWAHEVPMPVALLGRHVLERRWLRAYRGTRILTVSDSSRESLMEYGLSNIAIVPEGIELPDQLPKAVKEATPTFIFCGRMSHNKRPDHVVRAFKKVQQQLPDARLWMVGDGDMLPKLRKLAGPNVEFFGRVSHEQKFELMARAHALVVTSVREGWGLVVSEAAAVGTTAVGYDVPGLRDSVPQSNGVLVPADQDALSQSLIRIVGAVVDGSHPKPVVGGVTSWRRVADEVLEASQLELNEPIDA